MGLALAKYGEITLKNGRIAAAGKSGLHSFKDCLFAGRNSTDKKPPPALEAPKLAARSC